MAGQIGISKGWELSHESFLAAHAFMDEDGRPLGELNAPEECLRGVEMQLRQCKYQGSRLLHANPMNVSALRQLTDHWDEIIGGMRFLRRSYLRLFGLTDLTHQHTWRLAKIATTLPAYLLCRPEQPVEDGQIPVAVAGLFKVLAGVFQTAQHILMFGAAMGAIPEGTPSPDDILAYAERNELLIGTSGVCAGPPQKILEILEALLRDGEHTRNIADGPLPAQVGDPLPFFCYAVADAALQVRKFVFGIEWRAQMFQVQERLQNMSPDPLTRSTIGDHLKHALARFPVPLPDFLLAASGDAIRHRLVAVLVRELDEMTQWLEGQGVSTPASPVIDIGRWKDMTRECVQRGRGGLDLATSLICDALAEYLALERQVMAEFQGRQSAIDQMLEREGDPTAVDGHAMTAAFGQTPRDALAGLLHLTVEHGPEGVSIRAGAAATELK